MHLETGNSRLAISQLGPDFVILAETSECRSRHAEIALQVDSAEERWPVELPEGLAAVGERTRIVNLS